MLGDLPHVETFVISARVDDIHFRVGVAVVGRDESRPEGAAQHIGDRGRLRRFGWWLRWPPSAAAVAVAAVVVFPGVTAMRTDTTTISHRPILRRSSSRSASVAPPHTPASELSMAWARHSAITGHVAQIALACSSWPRCHTGNHSSGLWPRQAACPLQSPGAVL